MIVRDQVYNWFVPDRRVSRTVDMMDITDSSFTDEVTRSSVRSSASGYCLKSSVDVVNALDCGEQIKETNSNGCDCTRDEIPDGIWFKIVKPEPEEPVDEEFVPALSQQSASSTSEESLRELAKPFCLICGVRFDDISSLNIHLSQMKDQLHRQYLGQCHYQLRVIQVAPISTPAILPSVGDTPHQQKTTDYSVIHTGKEREFIRPQEETVQRTATKLYHCEICPHVCTSIDVLELHMQKHGKKHKCEVCNKVFKFASKLASHRSIHSRVFKCDLCQKEFTRCWDLKRHMLKGCDSKQGQEPKRKPKQKRCYRCDICQMELMSSKGLGIHMQIHNHSEEEVQECDVCHRVFASKSRLKHHMKSHSGKSYKCEICDKKLLTPLSFATHMSNHSIGQGQSHKCDKCQREFVTLSALRKHMHSHEEGHSHEMYTCEVCQKEFTSPSGLKRHLHSHEQPLPQCGICKRVFDNPAALAIHMSCHSDKLEPSYQCNTCQRTFATPTGLKLHVRVHDIMTQSRETHSCKVCQREFSRSADLLRHSHTHEQSCDRESNASANVGIQGIHEPRREALYKCDVCLKEFRGLSYLRLHTKLHTKEKQYKCVVCQKHFKTVSCLTSHMSTHIDIKPYQCDICEKRFSRLSTMIGHKITHPKERVF